MALFLEFLAQEWILALALLVVIVMLVLHEARKSGPSVSPQQAIGLINSEQGVFLDLRDARISNRGILSRRCTFLRQVAGAPAELENTETARCPGMQDGPAVGCGRQAAQGRRFFPGLQDGRWHDGVEQPAVAHGRQVVGPAMAVQVVVMYSTRFCPTVSGRVACCRPGRSNSPILPWTAAGIAPRDDRAQRPLHRAPDLDRREHHVGGYDGLACWSGRATG